MSKVEVTQAPPIVNVFLVFSLLHKVYKILKERARPLGMIDVPLKKNLSNF